MQAAAPKRKDLKLWSSQDDVPQNQAAGLVALNAEWLNV